MTSALFDNLHGHAIQSPFGPITARRGRGSIPGLLIYSSQRRPMLHCIDMKMLKVHQNAPTSMLKSENFSGGHTPGPPYQKGRGGRGGVG
jgi:hypothetical protein